MSRSVLLRMEVANRRGILGPRMPGRGIQHIDLAVSDVERSVAFYVEVLGPLGLRELERYPTYRGTEEVVYLHFGDEGLGLRPADGGAHRYYDVGLEHLAFEVDSSEEVDVAYERCLRRGDRIHCPPEEDSDIPGYYAFFVFDPDGFRIEVFSPGPEWSSRIHVTSHASGQQTPLQGRRT
jgi:catechol 2,3-dioxygenase-like lactoylglutathione lyase family enzyme